MPLLLPRPALPIQRESLAIAGDCSPSTLALVGELDPHRVVGEGAGCRTHRPASLNDQRSGRVEGVPPAWPSIRPVPGAPARGAMCRQGAQHVLENVGFGGLKTVPPRIHVIKAEQLGSGTTRQLGRVGRLA